MTSKLAGALANAALVLASCLAVLLLGEAVLRLVHPKYEHLAQATWAMDVFLRDPGRRPTRWHPDTGEQHAHFLNNLGLRQHRDFTAADLESTVNIGFFGDSFTENITMPVEFSFTEPLDYLVNVEREGVSKEGGGQPSFNVLNYGHDGWGTAQSLLRYEASNLRGTGGLDHVFYVFIDNDLNENIRHGLFRLDDRGQLERAEAGRRRGFGSALLSKLHLSYLALDVALGLSGHMGWSRFDPPPSAFPLFRQLLRRFKAAVEADGASFSLVLPPHIDLPAVAAIVAEEGVESVSLMDCFAERDPAHRRTPWLHSPYRFENNWHWNEAANRLAAMCLHRFLERSLGLRPLSDKAVEDALNRYYAAFETPPHGRPAGSAAAAIRARYIPLEDGAASVVGALPAPRAGKRVVSATFDVYLHDGWLSYVKAGCERADFDSIFFLHVVPADAAHLSPDRLAHGFDNLDFWGYPDQSCTVWARLPGYAMERIRTGQYLGEGDGVHQVLWEGEHVLAQGRP